MAAGITDRFTNASNGSRPTPTTLNALLASGASPGTANCAALTGWPTGTAVHFVIYTIDSNGKKVSGSQTDWKAIVSGATLTNMTLKAGTNSGYSVGAIVEASPTAAWADDIATGLQAEHKQTGAHSAVTADSVVVAGDVTDNAGTVARVVRDETLFDHVASGGVWSGDAYASTLNGSMTAVVAYIDGYRLSINAVAGRAFTASKDTYIDILRTGTAGSIVYTEVANNAASPALAANSIRIGIIISGATNIAAVGSVNQGETTKLLPIASSIPYTFTDSLGNMICNRNPNPIVIGYRQIVSSFVTASTPPVQITGLSVPVIVPANRKIEVYFYTNKIYTTAGGTQEISIWDGAVGGTQLQQAQYEPTAINKGIPLIASVRTQVTGSKTYNIGAGNSAGGGNTTVTAAATVPCYAEVRLA